MNKQFSKVYVFLDDKELGFPTKTKYEFNQEEFTELNQRGYGIFQSVNSFDLTKPLLPTEKTYRCEPHLSNLDYVYGDLDIAKHRDGQTDEQKKLKKEAKLQEVLPFKPTMVMETANGIQPYWKIKDGTVTTESKLKCENIIWAIINKFNGDPGAKDLSRILRMPNFYHNKGTPFLCKIIHEADVSYTLDELAAIFPFTAQASETIKNKVDFWEALKQGFPEGNRHSAFLSLCLSMLKGKPEKDWGNVWMLMESTYHQQVKDTKGFSLQDAKVCFEQACKYRRGWQDEEKTSNKKNEKTPAEAKSKKKFIASKIMPDGSIIEMICNKEKSFTQFAVFKEGKVEFKNSVEINGEIVFPYPPNDLIKNNVVSFPSAVEEFISETELLKEIESFIHKYLDVSEFFQKIATYYVLFTWTYDRFNELPYLRALGDYGSGKTRFLQVIGSICYKPIFAGGATTVSPIFRILNDFKGTLILDEADYRFSDTTAEIIKILNNGFSKGFPVLRSEGKGSFEVRAFDVFSPKIVATRKRFQDKALESRFLIEEMEKGKLRADVPINLPDSFWDEATSIRNKLLNWRFLNYGKKIIQTDLIDSSLEPRLNQIITPLMSVIENTEVKESLKVFIANYNKEIISDRGMEIDAQILEIILGLNGGITLSKITMKSISDTYNLGLENLNEKISPKKMAWYVKERLKLKTERGRDGYFISENNKEKIENLKRKYGIE